jgi:hypothetical protein
MICSTRVLPADEGGSSESATGGKGRRRESEKAMRGRQNTRQQQLRGSVWPTREQKWAGRAHFTAARGSPPAHRSGPTRETRNGWREEGKPHEPRTASSSCQFIGPPSASLSTYENVVGGRMSAAALEQLLGKLSLVEQIEVGARDVDADSVALQNNRGAERGGISI